MAEKTETVILDFQVDAGDAVLSIEKLTQANKQLREERKKVDLSTKEGIDRVNEINRALDKNNEIIKANSSTLEKNRLNVGNYTNSIKDAIPAMDKFTGGLVSSAQGFAAMAKQAIAFIATPIGAVIGALGLAFGALMTYIKGSDDAGDRFAKTTAALGLVLEGLQLIVEKVGGFIFDTFEFIAGAVESVISTLSPATGAAIAAAKAAGEELAQIQDDIENRENDAIKRRAEVNEQVQLLREKAITQEGALKRKTIEEAIALEKQLAEEETALAQSRLDAFNLENKQRIEAGKLTGDQLKEIRTLEADVINQRAAGASATIKFQKEVEKLRDEEIKQQALLNEQRQIEIDQKNNLEQVNARLSEQSDKEVHEDIPAKITGMISLGESIQKTIELGEKEAAERRKNAQIDTLMTQQKLANASTVLSQIKGLFDEESKGYKALAISQASIDTYRAASAALAPPPVGAGPLFGPILAATTIALGLANVAKIAGFRKGGYTGDGSPDQVAGVTHGREFVMPESVVSRYGKEHFQSYMDGSIVANANTAGVGGGSSMAQAPVYLNYTEMKKFVNEVELKESIVSV